MSNILFRFRVALVGMAIAASCTNADAWVVHDPGHTAKTVAAEVARAADAARQIQVEINQYRQMLIDGMTLADPIFKPFGDTLRSLYSVYMQGQSLMYQAQNMDSMFGLYYPSYYTYLGTMGQGRSMSERMEDRYKAWSDKGYQNTRTALLSAGVRVDGMNSEQAMLEALVEQSNRAGGQMQAIQAASQIAANQAQQLQDLRMLVAENTTLHANYMAWKIEQETFDSAFRTQYRSAPVINSPSRGF